MESVTIHDLAKGVLAVHLIDILRLCEPKARQSSWHVDGVDSLGLLSDVFNRIGDDKAVVEGDELLRLAAGVYQIIDGNFAARLPCDDTLWLSISAIDSSYYAIATDDKALLARIRARYSDVRFDGGSWSA